MRGTLAPQPPESSVRAGEEGAGIYPAPPTHALPDARTLWRLEQNRQRAGRGCGPPGAPGEARL